MIKYSLMIICLSLILFELNMIIRTYKEYKQSVIMSVSILLGGILTIGFTSALSYILLIISPYITYRIY